MYSGTSRLRHAGDQWKWKNGTQQSNEKLLYLSMWWSLVNSEKNISVKILWGKNKDYKEIKCC